MLPTRDRLLATAARLFWEKGYHATSVAEILKVAEANSGSLYYFFPTKQDLLVGVLRRYEEGIDERLIAPLWGKVEDPVERIFTLLDGYRTLLLSTDFHLGCPIGNLALEMAEPDPPVREGLVANFRAWSEAVEGCLEAMGDQIPPELDRRALAHFVLTTMEGGVMLARSYRDIVPFDHAVAMLRDYVRRLLAKGAQ